jgi:hypothetical protein
MSTAGQKAGAQQLEPLVEQDLEVLDGAALEEHVPVGPRRPCWLLVRAVRLDPQRLGTAARAVPQRRNLSLDRERHLEAVTVRTVVDDRLAVSELDAALVLVAGGTQPRAAESRTLGHCSEPFWEVVPWAVGSRGPGDRRSDGFRVDAVVTSWTAELFHDDGCPVTGRGELAHVLRTAGTSLPARSIPRCTSTRDSRKNPTTKKTMSARIALRYEPVTWNTRPKSSVPNQLVPRSAA